MQPDFTKDCEAWIGVNNWAPSNLGYIASSMGTSVAPWPVYITDEDDLLRENCVAITGNGGYVDYHCECARLPFFCQVYAAC